MIKEVTNGIWEIIKPLIPIFGKFLIAIVISLLIALLIIYIKNKLKKK